MTRHSRSLVRPLAWLLTSMLVAARVGAADDLLPAVDTSAPAAAPSAAPAPNAKPAATPSTAVPAAPARAATPATRGGNARDRVELENTQITGNRELPKVMYVVPWKKPDLGDFAGRPAKSLLDELLEPVDRDVFKRQNRYFSALQPDAAASSGSADTPPAAVPVRGGDEK